MDTNLRKLIIMSISQVFFFLISFFFSSQNLECVQMVIGEKILEYFIISINSIKNERCQYRFYLNL